MPHYKLCVFGHPISHSLSPKIHQLFAKQTGMSLTYDKIDPGPNGFALAVEAFKLQGGHGFNVTMPFKQQAYALMDELSDEAKAAKAVNTVKIQEDGRMFGDNTDGLGLVAALTKACHVTLQGKTMAILGAGGAVQGILPTLLANQPERIYLINRTLEKALQLAAVSPTIVPLVLETKADDISTVVPIDLLIHAMGFQTHAWPVGLKFSPETLAYDLSYGEHAKMFITWAKTKGIRQVSDGLSMLVYQAAFAFQRWTGVLPDAAPILAALRA